jgi:hypothetical protein
MKGAPTAMQRAWNRRRTLAVVLGMTQYHSFLASLAAALLIVATAQAQTPKPQPQPQPPAADNAAPHDATPGKDSGNNPLSEQLSRSGGVIKPPENVDRQIEAPTPDPGPKSMPVVPPPGSPGGNPDVKPK